MKLKYKRCCPISARFKIEIISRDCDNNGEPTGKVRIGLRLDTVWVNYCPICGEKTKIEQV